MNIAHHAPSCVNHAPNSSLLESKSLVLRVKTLIWPRKPPVMGKNFRQSYKHLLSL